MGEYVLTLLAAAAVTYLLTPAVRRLAVAVGAVHAPRDRDVHVVPTPLLGGFAMYAGLATGLLVASRIPALTGAFAEPNMAKGLLLAGGLVVIMGFVDDRWGLGALSKLAGQVAAGVILVWSGAEVTWVPLPGGGTFGLTTDQQTAATILVVVVTINAVNFIDGLDGLATGIVGIGAAAFFVYYYTLTHRLGLPDQTGPALASAVLVGICLGFLPHNFYPARIFMGDTGAMLLGLLLAFAPISSSASLDPASLTDSAAYHAGTVNRFGAIVPLLLPAAILLIPYADLLMAVVRRTRAGTSPFSADKKHLHHRLLAIGHSHKISVLLMYLWAALFAGCVAWLSIVRTSLYILIIVTGAMMLALALLLVSMPRLRPWVRAAPGSAAPTRRAATVVPQASPAAVRSARAAPGRNAVARQTAGTAAGAGSGSAPGASPRPPFARAPEPGPALGAPAGPPVAGKPEPGRAAGQPVEPPAEPAPWPGFAQDERPGSASPPEAVPEPSGGPAAEPAPVPSASPAAGPAPVPSASPVAGPAPVPSASPAAGPAPVPPVGPAAEPRSWFEPAQPAAAGHPNGSAALPESGQPGPGEPDGDEPVPDRWSAPTLPRVDPRLPASLQDRH